MHIRKGRQEGGCGGESIGVDVDRQDVGIGSGGSQRKYLIANRASEHENTRPLEPRQDADGCLGLREVPKRLGMGVTLQVIHGVNLVACVGVRG